MRPSKSPGTSRSAQRDQQLAVRGRCRLLGIGEAARLQLAAGRRNVRKPDLRRPWARLPATNVAPVAAIAAAFDDADEIAEHRRAHGHPHLVTDDHRVLRGRRARAAKRCIERSARMDRGDRDGAAPTIGEEEHRTAEPENLAREHSAPPDVVVAGAPRGDEAAPNGNMRSPGGDPGIAIKDERHVVRWGLGSFRPGNYRSVAPCTMPRSDEGSLSFG